MTLILSNVGIKTRLVSLSDVLTSSPTGDQRPELNLPFQTGPLVLPDGEYSPSDVAQKTVTFGRTVFMWSDSEIVAKILCRRIFEVSEGGALPLTLEEIHASYGEDQADLAEVSFIYHYLDPEGAPTRLTWQCQEHQVDPFDIAIAGTGAWHFLENMTYVSSGSPNNFKPWAVLPELLARTLFHGVLEHLGTQSLQFLYGGWFEMMSTADGYAQKLPYVVKFWRADGDDLREGPLFFGWYDGFDLCVAKLDPEDAHVENFWVKDLLGRVSGPLNETVVPAFIFHAVFNAEGDHWSYLDPYGLTTTFADVRITKDRELRTWFSKRLRKLLLDTRDSTSSKKTNYGRVGVTVL